MDSPVLAATFLQIAKYMNVCSFVLLIYDSLLTLDMEVEYIWNAKWGVGKILFLLERYPAFIDVFMMVYYALVSDPSNKMCKSLYAVAAWSITLGIGIAEAILIMRTYALWAKSRRILFFILLLYICILIPAFVILMLLLHSREYGSPPLPSVKGCYRTEGTDITFIDFLLLSVFETIIMILTIWVGLVRYRHCRSPLVVTLYRDGILYFIWLFLISLGNIIVLVAGPPEFFDLITTFQRVMHSSLSTRILLHARAAANSSINNGRSLTTITDIQFKPRETFHVANVSDNRTAP